MRAAARKVCELGHDLLHEAREDELEILWNRIALGFHDLHLFADAQRIVRADLRSESVLQRSDDPAARRVVLGVRARDDEQVERKPDAIATDLHVLLFHDVEQADLDPLRQVRQLVDAEDAAVGARQQAVVDGELVGEVAALRNFDGVDLSDQVGDGDVGRREFLAVTLVAVYPGYLDTIAVPRDEVEAVTADRRERVVVDFATRNGRDQRIKEGDERAHDTALRLAPLAEHDHVVSGYDRVRELRKHRLVIADDSKERRLAAAQPRQQVAAHLLLYGLAHVPGRSKLGNGSSGGGGHSQHYREAERQKGLPRA